MEGEKVSASQPLLLDKPTRSYTKSSCVERGVGFLAASIFSLVYVVSPLAIMGASFCVLRWPTWRATWRALAGIGAAALLPCSLSGKLGPYILKTWPLQQIPKYFRYEEFHEITDAEIADAHAAGRRFIFGAHPHGVVSFSGICAAVAAAGAADGLASYGVKDLPTAVASVIKMVPILKNVLGVFGLIEAGKQVLTKRLKQRGGSLVIYVGGMAELFRSSPKREVVFLTGRKGFIKLAMSTGADVIPVYMFGNTTVLSILSVGPLATLSRKLGVSVTFFWGRFGLPMPKPVRVSYARGRPLGLPHIENPTEEDLDRWHKVYCDRLVELFDRYKGNNPDYKHKTLVIE